MKNIIRQDCIKKRNLILDFEQEEKSQKILEKIIDLKDYKESDWIFVYIEMGSEVKTKKLIEKAWLDGKKVAVPIAKKNRYMYFVQISDFENMKKTDMGVIEPDISEDKQVYPTDETLFIVPGSVFDESKNRYGYGSGYYDTYIDEKNIKKTVGICYDFQVLKEIPVEEFDKKLTKIVTDIRIID